MRSHQFINSLLYLIILLVAKESRANENNGGIRCFFVLFIDKPYISQVIHFNVKLRCTVMCSSLLNEPEIPFLDCT